jgi:hypothetical protein
MSEGLGCSNASIVREPGFIICIRDTGIDSLNLKGKFRDLRMIYFRAFFALNYLHLIVDERK